MSDPMNERPGDPQPPPPEAERKSSSPLIWILILIALIAFAWYFYNRNAGSESTGDLTPPAATSDAMTPAPSSPAEGAAGAEKPKARAPKKVARVEPKDREATVLDRPVPSYPPEAYRAREEGTVVVKAQVDALGNASDVEIVSRSGSRVLDRAAMNEVRKWKFNPAIKDGRTVTSSVQVPVDYRLDEQ
jgi:protein TonB